MHIVLAHSHANTFGGGERAVLELARGLASEHEVRLLLGGFDMRRTYPDLASWPHQRVGRLQWPVLGVQADAIVTNTFGANLLALRNGRRVVYWVHTVRSIFLTQGARRIDLLLRRALDRVAVRRAASIVANSRYTARWIRRLYGREADAVVYPGVDLEFYQPVGERGRYALTVGRLSPEKGLDRLLDAWRELPELPLHVVGTGAHDFVEELRARAKGSTVVFRGPLTPEQLAQEYRGAAVAVFTPYREELGIAPLEAMASGIPVVAWREGGLVETIVDGETGYLASDAVILRQRVRLLLHDAQLWETLSHGARQRAQAFSWQRTVAEMSVLLKRVAGQPAPIPRE
jgi:glycosyltransferase involved in cell wall biosynthesis